MSGGSKRFSQDDAFVNVSFDDDTDGSARSGGDTFHKIFTEQASGKHIGVEVTGATALRKLYPKHSLVMTQDYRLNVLNFAGAYAVPIQDVDLVTNVMFQPLARRSGTAPGVLVDNVQLGGFHLGWDKYEFIVYIAQWSVGFSTRSQTFILHEGPEAPARSLLLAAGSYQNDLHEEIWIFNQGFWSKSHSLWVEVQKASWSDVVLKDEFKKALQKDIYGFFESEKVYKELAIPWKRGIIMHGPLGNGKTISIKAIMKTCDEKGFKPLYVKSFQSYMGEEGSMAAVFSKARELSPCVIVLEDLDSLINDRNRSFFLNQLDGLEGNDGLLVIGTTNHFDRLDPGLSTRPSRFDRKYLFDDPDRVERALYAKYWQGKLKNNTEVTYPDPLVEDIADSTDKFSFAYLKEAFVSSLVLLAGYEEEDKPEFETVIKSTIKTLRKQLANNSAALSGGDIATESPATWRRSHPFRIPGDLMSHKSASPQPISPTILPGRDRARADRTFALADNAPTNPAQHAAPDGYARFRHLFNDLSTSFVSGEPRRERIYVQEPAPSMPGSLEGGPGRAL
ncbi:hypothetical protein PLICRDRAFT_128201 [Plicaturopsis crispa FD-325 SS-3]|nr:hypothetical protein PLICRDRAFT_128201 [Plicaturopsis crispa FD-325 SS-3]